MGRYNRKELDIGIDTGFFKGNAIMSGFFLVTLVGVITMATTAEARGFSLVEKGHECNGAERNMGYKMTLEECARTCEGTSDMFVYGTNEFGTIRCHEGKGCACYCEDASTRGCKKRIVHKGYNLFRTTGK